MIPEHYARDVVERCEHLIESLLPVVMGDAARRFGGPLGTTFLVAMSTPMILLPIERMLKPAANRDSVADDRTVDESLGKAVTETLSATATFGDMPFGRAGDLDERGLQTDGQAAMLAFVGAVMKGGRITSINVLHSGERDYRQFLGAWASWLRQAGVTAALNERVA